MDRYGGGYLYKGYAAQNGVRTAPVSGDRSNRGSSRSDDRVRASLVPDPASGTNPSDGVKESNLAGKNMAEMAYSPHLSKHSSPKTVDRPVKEHKEAQQQTSPVHQKSQMFDDFIKKVHDGANQPHVSAAPGNSQQPPYSSSTVNGVPSRVDYEKEGYNQPTTNGFGNDDYTRKSGRSSETNGVNQGSGSTPIRPTWRPAIFPQANGSQLGEPTTNLDKPSYSSNPNGLTYSDDCNSYGPKDRENSGAWAKPRHVTWASLPDNGYGDGYNDHNTKEGNGNYSQKNGSDVRREPTTGNWSRPNFSNWISLPRNGTQVTQPTSDIGKVIGFLNEAVNPNSGFGVNDFPRPRLSVPNSTAPNKDGYQETIDRSNLDNGRRYGNFKFPSQPR